jgi:hypothetical protein
MHQILAMMKKRVMLDQTDKVPAVVVQKRTMPLRILIPRFLELSIPMEKQELLGELPQTPRAFMQG